MDIFKKLQCRLPGWLFGLIKQKYDHGDAVLTKEEFFEAAEGYEGKPLNFHGKERIII